MRVVHAGRRAAAVVTLSAGIALLIPIAPAHAEVSGTLIAEYPLPDGTRGMSDADGSVIEYWMRGTNGTTQPASGALYVPAGTPPLSGWPIMAYDHGTSGLGPGCGGQSDPLAHPAQTIAGDEDALLQYLASQGFAVVAPDYLGLGRFDTGPHPYLGIDTEATATIDLVRAARAAHPELSRTWAVMGASQGGQAALGTGHLQATDAPDLDFRGTIAIDPESDVEKLAPLLGPGTPTPSFIADGFMDLFVSILAGLRAARSEVNVDEYLTPEGRSVLDSVGAMCTPQIMDRVRGLSIGELLAKPLSVAPMPAAADAYMTVPASGYNAPILLCVNITDTIVPSPLHGLLAAQLAAHGVDFRTVLGTGKHTQLNPQMWTAIEQFVARIRSDSAIGNP
ncbi:alpha/beta hydrolase family protein [Nocardia sp. NPDC049526]|uniref:alpha/beta hydrolase family protein n=1 Tax=Nocardia sp. NPDC049526 TaxID=3364316 RepID=UPI0037B6D10F